jgi:hypothetical protein
MTANHSILMLCLAGCNLTPRVPDGPDAAIPPEDTSILPAGTTVPSIETNPELLAQIRINDGLSDSALMMSGGVVTRSTGKSGGATVRFWNFGPAPVDGNLAVAAPLYVFGTVDAGVFTPLPDHPPLIDTVPGDVRYSAVRRVVSVPVTPLYAGEVITSLTALGEAVERGLVTEPLPDETWVNLPVVLPGTMLEVDAVAPLPAKQVYGRGYRIDVFELGTSLGRQPLRNGQIPIGQASGLQTGVATGDPPTLPTAVDPQPVFQFTIPTAPPGDVFSYTPLATEIVVRLANGVAPTAITSDADLFKRSANGAITAFLVTNVANFTVNTTTVNNLQIQFTEGMP